MKSISYLRVSTKNQGADGYGINAQRLSVENFVKGELISEFVEVESGRSKDRPQLMAALHECRVQGTTLVIGKIDRLARDVRFFLEILDDYKVDIRFAEFPDINPKSDEGRMILIGMANFAEFEGRRIGSRVKAALAVAKGKGVKLGGYRGADMTNARIAAARVKKESANLFRDRIYATVKECLTVGKTLTAAAEILNERKIPTSHGTLWNPKAVSRILKGVGDARN